MHRVTSELVSQKYSQLIDVNKLIIIMSTTMQRRDRKPQSFMSVLKSCQNLLSSKPSSHSMTRNFLTELRNLSGNCWRSVDFKNIVWVIKGTFWQSMFRIVINFQCWVQKRRSNTNGITNCENKRLDADFSNRTTCTRTTENSPTTRKRNTMIAIPQMIHPGTMNEYPL